MDNGEWMSGEYGTILLLNVSVQLSYHRLSISKSFFI